MKLQVALLALVTWAAAGPGMATDVETPQEAGSRWLPESCTPLLEVARAQGKHEPEGSAEARWNEHYRQGFEASRQRELETAETSFCLALEAAQEFGPRDLRFAETLDEHNRNVAAYRALEAQRDN